MYYNHIPHAPAIAILAFCAFVPESLHAETREPGHSYQLYGTLDTGMAHTRLSSATAGKTRQTEMHTSGHDDTRWGLRGRENLPGDSHIAFTLEAGFDSDTGAGSGFSLQSWLGIGHAHWGELRLGRQASSGQDFIADLAIGNWKDFGIDALLRASDNMRTAPRIRWQSSAWQGWQASISYSPDNHATQAAWRTRSAAAGAAVCGSGAGSSAPPGACIAPGACRQSSSGQSPSSCPSKKACSHACAAGCCGLPRPCSCSCPPS